MAKVWKTYSLSRISLYFQNVFFANVNFLYDLIFSKEISLHISSPKKWASTILNSDQNITSIHHHSIPNCHGSVQTRSGPGPSVCCVGLSSCPTSWRVPRTWHSSYALQRRPTLCVVCRCCCTVGPPPAPTCYCCRHHAATTTVLQHATPRWINSILLQLRQVGPVRQVLLWTGGTAKQPAAKLFYTLSSQ